MSGARAPEQPGSHERFGRAQHAAGDVGDPSRPAAGRPADRRRRRGDRTPLRHRSRARPGGFRRRGLLRHRRGALHRRLGAAARRARTRRSPGRRRSQGLAADPDRRSRPWPASAGRRTPTAGSCCRSWPSPRCCSCCTAAAAPGASPGPAAGEDRPGRRGPTAARRGRTAEGAASASGVTPPAWDPLGAAPFAWDLPEPRPVPAARAAAPLAGDAGDAGARAARRRGDRARAAGRGRPDRPARAVRGAARGARGRPRRGGVHPLGPRPDPGRAAGRWR